MPSQQQTTGNKSATIDFCIYQIITITTAIILLLEDHLIIILPIMITLGGGWCDQWQ